MVMRSREFSKLMASLVGLNPRQLSLLAGHVEVLHGQREVQALVSERLAHEGACPHCANSGFARWGYTPAGEQRYRCKACRKSFTGLTGTPFGRIHDKELLLDNAACMKESLSVRKTAEALGVHRNTAFRLRHLMMPVLATQQPVELQGVAEADEAFFRRSYKGLKKGMPRKPHTRGSPASKRGISKEQVAVLTAVSRGSRGSHITVLPSVPSAASIEAALTSVMRPDTVLCSDSASAYKTAAKSMGVLLRQIPRGSHKLGPYHIQNVNALHSRIKGWMRPFRGVATKNLPAYLAWFRFFDQALGVVKPRQLLLDAFGVPTTNTI
jgi:transposase-like protein